MFFKLAIFPNQKWAPDVYEGSSTLVFGFFSIFIKLSIFWVFCRFIYFIINTFFFVWYPWILFAGIGSLLFGAIGAIVQKNVKRFFAYTSMHHMGFILICINNNIISTFNSIIFYFITYTLAFFLFFIIFVLIVKSKNKMENFTYISDIQRTKFTKFSLIPFCLLISLSSMAGFPPAIGFFAKYFIFNEILQNFSFFFEHILIFFIAVFTSVISAYNYLKLINLLFFIKNNNKNSFTIFFIEIQKQEQITSILNKINVSISRIVLFIILIIFLVLLFPIILWEYLRIII